MKIKGLYVLGFNYKMVLLTQWTISSRISSSNASKLIPYANFKICFSFLIFSKVVLLFRFIYLLQFRSTYIIGNFFILFLSTKSSPNVWNFIWGPFYDEKSHKNCSPCVKAFRPSNFTNDVFSVLKKKCCIELVS